MAKVTKTTRPRLRPLGRLLSNSTTAETTRRHSSSNKFRRPDLSGRGIVRLTNRPSQGDSEWPGFRGKSVEVN